MIKLTARELTPEIQNYLINNLCFDGYDLKVEPFTVKEKLQAFYKIMLSEYGHNFTTHKNKAYQDVITDYLQGLPSTLTIEFYNGEIFQLLKKWNVCNDDIDDDNLHKLIDQYWLVMGAKLLMLLRKFDIWDLDK